MLELRQKFSVVFGFWAILGFLYATQNYLFYKLQGMDCQYLGTLADQGPNFLLWGLYSPLILKMRTKYPVIGEKNFRNIFTIHFPLLLAISTGHILFLGSIRWLVYASGSSFTYFEYIQEYSIGWLYFQFILYFLVLLFGYFLEYYEKYRQKEQTALYLEKLLLDSELKVLKDQLHPHFLFNTLNTVSMLIRQNEKSSATKIVANLSDLLRIILEKRFTQWTRVADEIAFVNKYLEIMSVRFPDKFSYNIDIGDGIDDYLIPDLILQPVVENSIKHGIADKTDESEIKINVELQENRISIKVIDNGKGFNTSEKSEGVGIYNIRARLDKLYNSDFQFEIKSAENKGTIVTFILPAKTNKEITEND